MADAKITLNTDAKNEGLEKLHTALAEGIRSVASMTRQLKDMEKATKSGTEATDEQRRAMVELQKTINQQKAANSAYVKEIGKTTAEIRASVKEMTDADKGASKLASAFKFTEGFTTAFSVAIGSLATNIATAAVSAMAELAGQVVNLGAQMQQSVAHLAAMTGGTDTATEAYRALNDAYRNTNFDETAVMNMGTQLMRMGYSAQNAAGLIQLCADASAGLGTGQQGAQQLVDAISRIQAVGELTTKQMQQLEMSGVKMDEAFRSLGMNGKEAMEAVKNGTLDSQQAITALTGYLSQYDGKMAESKNNTIDAWSDVTGNLATMCAEIGRDIFDAFNQSEIVQKLIDFTQALVDMVRSDATGAFSDLKAIAGEVLDFIGGLLGAVLDTIKLIIIILHDAYAAFKNFGQQVVDAIRPAVDVVLALYDAVKAVLSTIGKGFAGEVNASWRKTFGIDPDDPRNQRVLNPRVMRSATKSGGSVGGGGGGRSGGGGSAAKALSEEEKAVEALIKKYADASKQKWSLAKSTIELAKANLTMLVGENKTAEEKRIKLQALKDAHDQLLEGYNKELELASKIENASVRNNTLQSINEQIAAENKLYEAKVRATEFQSNMEGLQKQSKSILETAFGDPEDIQPKINRIKEDLVATMKEVDAAVANPDPEAQLNGLAKLLQTTPEALQEDLDAKGQSVASFAEMYKTQLAETAAAKVRAMSTSQQWAEKTKQYANQVGMSLGSAMADFIMGEKTAKEALADFAKSLIKNAVTILAQWLSVFAIYSAFPMIASGMTPADAANKTVFGITRKAQGGYISGPGTGTSDSIPAMLSNGEYVLRSAAVERIGVGTLNALNSGALHFANGGSVTDAEPAATGGINMTLNLSAVDAYSFEGFLNRGGLNKIKQALFEDNRQFGSEAGVF